MKRPTPPRNRMRKFVASLMLMVTVLTPTAFIGISATTIGIMAPQPVHAQGAVVKIIGLDDVVTWLKEFITQGLIGAAKVGIKNALRSFLENLAYDTAVWLGSGDENQKPLLFTKDAETYLKDQADAATGEFLNTLAQENGYFEFNLCDLNVDANISLQFQLLLPYLAATEKLPYTPDCTLTEIRAELGELRDDIRAQALLAMEDPSSIVDIQASFAPAGNPLGMLLSAADEAVGASSDAERAAMIDRTKSDFKSQAAPVSGYIQTPAAVAEGQTLVTLQSSREGETVQQDNILADALSVFLNTLASKMLERIMGGMFSFYTESDISESISGGGGVGGGIAEAQEKYADFITPSFTAGGEVDILSHFANCPNEGADVTNCVLTEGFRLAIEEGMTVKEAMDQGLISPSTPFAFGSGGEKIDDPQLGISYRNIKILKAYSVVPVGWVLAAEYNRDFDGTPLTLESVTSAFDQCDETNYSPYCGLVDPNWPLYSPDVYCALQGYGENVVFEDFLDMDGSEYTPDELVISRLESCLDTQTCLEEDDSGNCSAYGYCTKQERIYKFNGDDCPSYYASCEAFTDADDNEVAYLQNTLNYNDCSTDNVGCQWRCLQYNAADAAFQCSGQNESFETCADANGCAGTIKSDGSACTSSCTVAQGSFRCENADAETCYISSVADSVSGLDSAISFDDDVRTCLESDNGCREVMLTETGANLLLNNGFEYYDNDAGSLAAPLDDATTSPFDDLFGFSAADGSACSAYANPQGCLGWEQVGITARATDNFDSGTAAVQLQPNTSSGFILARYETGQPLANRTFTLTYAAQNPDGGDCNGQYFISSDSGAADPYPIPGDATDITYDEATFDSSWAQVTSDDYTFAETDTNTMVVVGITGGDSCALMVDSVKLEEGETSTGYAEYGPTDTGNVTYVNTASAFSCQPDEVGCDLYTPVTGESEIPIPGIITNPLSEVCGDGNAYTDPGCSQCYETTVGCDAFIPIETPYEAPIKYIYGFANYNDGGFDADLAAAVAARRGFYCEGTSIPCSPERQALDCPGNQCVPSVSIIPSTGETCTAENVGCEQYVNLDEVALGGEGINYYKYIKQCVKPTTAQEANNEIETFYTFEGSDITGYQLRSWLLKKSDADNGPCTHLDLYGNTAETPEADCVDNSGFGLAADYQDCSPADIGDDPDCAEFYDTQGNAYYRSKSATISVSDDCEALRNVADDRIYYSIPEESSSCPASADQCREYKGSQGGNVQILVSDDFDSAAWDGGEASAETVTANIGLSMAIGTGTGSGSTEATESIAGQLDLDNSYVVSFWAKADTNGETIDPFVYSATDNAYYYFDDTSISLTDEWRQYEAGPFAPDTVNDDEVFGFLFNGNLAYVDNVELRKNDSHYLIAETADYCPGFEGCEEYTDSNTLTHYLKSFVNLCSESVVGCQPVIDTQNSDYPFYELYNGENEYAADDVAVPADEVAFYAVNDAVLCGPESAGCSYFGLPELAVDSSPVSFEGQYLINDPDDYESTLCQEQQRSCEEYTTSTGEITYFKNPGSKVCEYDSNAGIWKNGDGQVCPLQNPNVSPSQPKGPVCNGGIRSGKLCNSDSDCPASDSDTIEPYTFSDIIDVSGPSNPQYSTWIYDETDRKAATSASYLWRSSGSKIDRDTNNPTGQEPLVILIYGSANINVMSDYTYTITTDNPTNPVIDVTLPAGLTAPNTNAAFYVTEDGSLIWADPGQDGDSESYANPGADYISFNEASDDQDVFRCVSDDITDSDGDGVADTGWAGQCSGTYSGCTLYLDPNMPTEIDNYSFETDVKSNTNITSGDPDGIPDDWYYFGDANGYFSMVSDEQTGPFSIWDYGCTTFEQASESDGEPAFDRTKSLKLQRNNASVSQVCMVSPDSAYAVDPNKYYTLSANVYTTSADAQFGIGLVYYNSDGNVIGFGGDEDSYAIAAYEGGGRSPSGLEPTPNEWQRYQGQIGPNLVHSFPDGTYFVKVFLEQEGDDPVYFDNIAFSENGEYTYLNYSVDGTSESDMNTCNGVVDADAGCVSFRDTTTDTLAYLGSQMQEEEVNPNFSLNACTFDSADEAEACRSRANTADGNTVIKVRKTRECAEWLACKSARVVTDDEGNEETTCFEVGRCQERNEDTGACTEWADVKNADEVGFDDDMSAVSQPGNVDDLVDIQDVSGYATAGAEWVGVCGSDGFCLGGANSGDACTSNSDCDTAQITYGYYPYDWMPQRGLGGAATTTDLVKKGDFEAVYCSGESEYDDADVIVRNVLEADRDKAIECTQDVHCRTIETETTVKTEIKTQHIDPAPNVQDVDYHVGWCENTDPTDNFSWGDSWDAYGDAQMSIIDHDDAYSYEKVAPQGVSSGATVAAATLNLNNVLYVQPADGDASGARTQLEDGIINGYEYTLTFDGRYVTTPDNDNDYVQIGIQHGNDTGNVDFFEVGSAMADIVFVVDASSSMSPFIANIQAASTDFANNLFNAGIDAQMAIVTVGGNREPAVVDLGEYPSPGIGSGNDYGASGGVSVDFTTFPATFSGAMGEIATDLDGGWCHTYDALQYVEENNFPGIGGGDDWQLRFRPGAQRFVILLTDAPPEEGDSNITSGDPDLWEPSEESAFEDSIPANAYTLFSIVDYNVGSFSDYPASQAYDSITQKLGGNIYDINLADYSEILNDIVNAIDDATTNFRLTDRWDSYALGPIIIEQKDDPTDASNLFIGQAAGSTNTPFLIDNVSLKPAIEVNMENNPHTSGSSWLIGRTCRAYPEDNSTACNYTEPNGAIYTGWKGYCLENDEYNSDKCVVWWPVDVIAGEPDTTDRLKVQYAGFYPAYHCLVAKGNGRPGACENGGSMCLEDSDCSSGRCIGGNSSDSWTYANGEEATITAKNYRLEFNFDEIIIDNGSSHGATADGDKIEAAKFMKFDATPVEKILHISEIDHIKFDIGSFKYDNTSDDDEAGESYTKGATSFDTSSLETETSELFHVGSGKKSAFPDYADNDDNKGVYYAYQKGVWCGDGSGDVCTLSGSNNIHDNLDDADFVFVSGVTGQNAGNDMVFDSGQVKNNGSPLSPFHSEARAPKDGDMWDNGGIWGYIAGLDNNNNGNDESATVDGVEFTNDYFVSRYGTGDHTCFDSVGYHVTDQRECGANMVGIDFDFENGYLDAVYLFYWDGFRRFDAQRAEDVYWKYYLREPCLLAVESADDEANAVPWHTRVQEESDYVIPMSGNDGYTYSMEHANSMYGRIGTVGNEEPNELDGLQMGTTNFVDFTASSDYNLPYIYLNVGSGAALPYSCIGRCYHVRADDDYGDPFDGSTGPLWTGFDGVCSELDGSDAAQLCSDGTTCDNGTCTSDMLTGEGVGAANATYHEQLNAAASAAWDRYRLIFADIGDEVYVAPQYSTGSDTWQPFKDQEQGTDHYMQKAELESLGWLSALNDGFASMTECANETRSDSQYCGLRPEVMNIRVNQNDTGDMEIADGTSVVLEFDSDVDPDQEPLLTIRVAWEGAGNDSFDDETSMSDPWEAASVNGHYYSHTYTCDPTGGYYNSDVGACEYRLKVQIQDNWSFCSGNEGPQTVTRGYGVGCTSFDSYDGTIYVTP